MEDYMAYVPKVRFELIPLCDLVSSQDYQRTLSESQIEKAVADFDVHQINPVKVSQRDGINYVVDGQHTVEIVARASGSDKTPVWCMISDNLEYQQEADIFANQAKHTRPLTSYEIFVGHLEAGSHEQLTIRDLVESYNLRLSGAKKPGTICAISALEFIYEQYGYHVLNRTLMLVVGAWEGDMNSFTGNILRATAKLIVTYGETLKNDTFREKLGENSPRYLSRIAKERHPGSMGFAEAMVLAYNGKKKPGSDFYLDMQKLYSKSNRKIKEVMEEDAAQIEAAELEIAQRVEAASTGSAEQSSLQADPPAQAGAVPVDFETMFRKTFFPIQEQLPDSVEDEGSKPSDPDLLRPEQQEVQSDPAITPAERDSEDPIGRLEEQIHVG